MAQLVRDQMDDAQAKGESRWRVFWLAIWDVVLNGALERSSRVWSYMSESTGNRVRWTMGIRQDFWHAFRQFRRRPTLALATVLILALGIGANTAVFSVVDGVLLQEVPLPNADRLVRVFSDIPNNGASAATLPGFRDWAREKGPFAALGGFHRTVHSLSTEGMPQRIIVGSTIGDFFGTAGLTTAIGRTYGEVDPDVISDPGIVLTDAFWRRSFGADLGVVGRTVQLDGQPVQVIGVLPPEEEFLRFGGDIDAWAPMGTPLEWMGRGTSFLTVLGRLESHLTHETGGEVLQAMARGLIATGTTENGVTMVPLREGLIGNSKSLLWGLQGAALILMLVVAINAANLLLARSFDRTGEFAVRAALGASRGRILRQVIIETTLLSLIGGVAGLGLAFLGRGMVLSLTPDLAALAGPATLSWSVVAYTFGTAFVIGVLAGLWPAIRAASRTWSAMKVGSGRQGSGGAQRGRRAMVALEIGLALVLVVSAGLMVRTISGLLNESLGFETDRVLTARITLPTAQYPEWFQRHRFFEELTERVAALPGVQAVGLTSALPISRPADGGPFQIEGRDWENGDGPSIGKKSASPGYFAAMGIPVLEGRAFTADDRTDSPLVTVVSQSMARRFFPNESPLGKKIRVGWWGNDFLEIVGVVGDIKQSGREQGDEFAAYIPHAQTGAPDATIVINAGTDPYSLTSALRSAVLEIDRGQPIYRVTSLDELVDGSLARQTALTTLLLGLSLIGLVISCLGVYAVTTQAVRGRRQEIGIRMALGANGQDILRSVMWAEGGVIGVGLLLGLGAVMLTTQAMETVLFGVTSLDPITLITSISTLGGIALIAAFVPALRAAKVDPAGSLSADR